MVSRYFISTKIIVTQLKTKAIQFGTTDGLRLFFHKKKIREVYEYNYWDIPEIYPLRIECALQWRHNRHDSVSTHQPHDCLLNRLFRRRSKKTSKHRVTGLCAGNSPVTGEFPAQMASNAENVSIWWRHHGKPQLLLGDCGRHTPAYFVVIWWLGATFLLSQDCHYVRDCDYDYYDIDYHHKMWYHYEHFIVIRNLQYYHYSNGHG